MASFYEIKVIPQPTVLIAKLDKFQYGIRSFREPLNRAVRQVMVPDIREQFASGGNPGWKPLAKSTSEAKRRMGKDHGILIRTGALQRAATQISQWKVTSTEAYFTDLPQNVAYGYPLDAGFSNARTGGFVPAREFIRLTTDQRDQIETIFDEWLNEREIRYLQ